MVVLLVVTNVRIIGVSKNIQWKSHLHMKGLVRCHHVLHLSQSRIQYYQLLLVAGASAAM